MLNLLWKSNEDSPQQSQSQESSALHHTHTSASSASIQNSHHTASKHADDTDDDADDDVTDAHHADLEWRIVIFIRHGNSIWNESTDKTLSNPYSAAKAFTFGVAEYAQLKFSSQYKHEESLYVDTPLSPKGMKQAYNLSMFLKHHEQLRAAQKLDYLQQHQSIASPIKDAWRSLQQFKIEWNRVNEKNHTNIAFSSLCEDALGSLTQAMQSIEHLMANATPYDAVQDIPEHTQSTQSSHHQLEPHAHHNADAYNLPLDISSILDILIGKNVPSKIVCSNLRRAISTCVLSLWNRLRSTTEKIYLLSCLQEIGINVDTHTDTRQFQVPQVSNFEMMYEHLDAKTLNEFYSTRIETIYNFGSKVSNSFFMESQQSSQRRLQLFAQWIFMPDHDAQRILENDQQGDADAVEQHVEDEKEASVGSHGAHHQHNGFKTRRKSKERQTGTPPAIIAVGHSAWIKAFFKTYLPAKSDFVGKNVKLSNCGVVAFRFYYNRKKQKYGIAPNSVTVVYKGFNAG